jgi:hypothetical protein
VLLVVFAVADLLLEAVTAWPATHWFIVDLVGAALALAFDGRRSRADM